MKKKVLKVHEDDNVVVALTNLSKGETVSLNGQDYTLLEDITAKHKFVATDLNAGDSIFMYGVLVGKAQSPIKKGGLISTANVKHAANDFEIGAERKTNWKQPDVSKFTGRTFQGYHRPNGEVGTANYWLVIPMVFCENRNLDVLQESLVRDLGYGRNKKYKYQAQQLIELYKTGKSVEDILNADIRTEAGDEQAKRLFPNVDGIKFLNHEGGCGGTRQDAQALCGLLAGYITHPNCAGTGIYP
jgi:altronate hydrolase